MPQHQLLETKRSVMEKLVGKNVHSVEVFCFNCLTRGINFPLETKCVSCGSEDTTTYYDIETIVNLVNDLLLTASQVEEWRDITDHWGYQVSSHGRVKSVARIIKYGKTKRFIKEKIRALSELRGYKKVSIIRSDGKYRNVSVHRLVAMAFIPNPLNKPAINHIDNDRSNNRVENLEWVTTKENCEHTVKTGRSLQGQKSMYAKIKNEDAIEIRRRAASGESYGSISKDYDLNAFSISRIARRKTWKNI